MNDDNSPLLVRSPWANEHRYRESSARRRSGRYYPSPVDVYAVVDITWLLPPAFPANGTPELLEEPTLLLSGRCGCGLRRIGADWPVVLGIEHLAHHWDVISSVTFVRRVMTSGDVAGRSRSNLGLELVGHPIAVELVLAVLVLLDVEKPIDTPYLPLARIVILRLLRWLAQEVAFVSGETASTVIVIVGNASLLEALTVQPTAHSVGALSLVIEKPVGGHDGSIRIEKATALPLVLPDSSERPMGIAMRVAMRGSPRRSWRWLVIVLEIDCVVGILACSMPTKSVSIVTLLPMAAIGILAPPSWFVHRNPRRILGAHRSACRAGLPDSALAAFGTEARVATSLHSLTK